uniref:hypothetical protein n=1 Tax=Vibrio vulnificus TaxID=672 RepID=UPI0039B5FDB6
MRASLAGLTLSAVLAASCATAPPPLELQPLPAVDVAHADFSNPSLWLCRPGLADDKCKVNLDATVIAANGTTSVEKFTPASDPK